MKIEIRRIGLNGLEGKKTEPNRTKYGRFEPVFDLVRFKNLKNNNFGLVIYFGSKPDRTENAYPYLSTRTPLMTLLLLLMAFFMISSSI